MYDAGGREAESRHGEDDGADERGGGKMLFHGCVAVGCWWNYSSPPPWSMVCVPGGGERFRGGGRRVCAARLSGDGALHAVELKAEPVAGDGVSDDLVGVEPDAHALDVVGGHAQGLDGFAVGVVDGVRHVASSGGVRPLGLVVEVRGESGAEASEVAELHGVAALELLDDYFLEGVEDGLNNTL